MKKLLGTFTVGMIAACAFAVTNYVDCSMADYTGHDGSSWEKAFKTIQEGVDATPAGGTILVAPGDYDEGGKKDTLSGGGLSNRVFIAQKSITIKSTGGAAVTRIIGQRDPATLNSGTVCPGLGDNAVRCICVLANNASETPVIEGFTIADGATADGGDTVKTKGGGVFTCNTSGTYMFFCDLVDCVVTNCIANNAGGVDGGRCIRCRIEDCESMATMSASRHASMFSCLIVRNGRLSGRAAVGYVFSGPSVGVLVNCTFVGNAGQALGSYPGTVRNCLFSENGSVVLGDYSDSQYPASYSHCLVDAKGSIPSIGTDCIKPADNLKQLFAPAVGDYRLQPTSDAIGAGDTGALELFPEQYRDKDFDGNPRKTGNTVNMGCYETLAPAPEGGAVIFSFPAMVNGFVGCCAGLHAYSANYPEMFDVSVAPQAHTNETLCFSGNNAAGGLVPSSIRWYPKWDDERVGLLTPTSSFYRVDRAVATKTLWVDCGYADGNSDGTTTKPYTNIQDAVTAASTTPTVIRVRPGTYSRGGARGGMDSATPGQNSAQQMNRVAVTSSQDLRIVSTDGPAVTTILGEPDAVEGDKWGCSTNSYRCVFIGKNSVVQGFTLSGGRSISFGGCAHVYPNGGHCGTITDCIITNCIAPRAAVVYGGRLYRCWIVDNFISGTNTTSNAILEQGHYSSCVFTSNRVTNPLLDAHPVVNMSGHMFHCSGIGDKQVRITNTNIMQLNCLWDSYRADAAKDGSTGNFNVDMPKVAHFTLISSPLARNIPYCRPYATSPAVFGGSIDYADYCRFASLDFEGNVIRFKNGKPTAGAFQNALPSVMASADGTTGGISPSGEAGTGLAAEDTITFTATKAGQRPFVGMRVNGELLENVSSYVWTVPDGFADSPVTVEAVYGTNWYVSATNGDDSRYGGSWETARRTLVGVMTNAVSYDVVIAGPGRYDTGTMTHTPLVIAASTGPGLSRVVVPGYVTLRSSEGAEKTFIIGAPSSDPDAYGRGSDAVRCVFLNNHARLCGFTLTGGRTDADATKSDDPFRGGGVFCRSDDWAYVEDCIISNNAACVGGGCYSGRYFRCRVTDNHASLNGAAFRNAHFVDCFIDRNVVSPGTVSAGYICWEFINSVYGANNMVGADKSSIFGWNSPNQSLMANSVVLAGQINGFFVSNTLYGASVTFTATSPKGASRQLADGELKFDSMGRPEYGSAAIDFGDVSFRKASMGDLDVDGGQRVYNDGKVDAGCCEFDWRPVYARIVGGSRASVGFASPEVARRADGKAVTLVDGTSFDVSVTNKLEKVQRYELEVQVSGAGTLSVLRGGEQFGTFTAGTEKIQFTGSDPLESFAFSFAGEGSADILSCRPCFGMNISVR